MLKRRIQEVNRMRDKKYPTILSVKYSFNNEFFLQLSYLGPGLAATIAIRLFEMEKLSFINRMFLLYFSLDTFAGLAQTFYLQKLVREK